MGIFDTILFEFGIRAIIIFSVYSMANKMLEDRGINAFQNGWFFSLIPFYFFLLNIYQKNGEHIIDFLARIIATSVIFGFIAFWIGFFLIKIKNKNNKEK
tara:strand:- start:181 stop:480 length:300 start_codon:yes stop_codon:yes gene_type:complete